MPVVKDWFIWAELPTKPLSTAPQPASLRAPQCRPAPQKTNDQVRYRQPPLSPPSRIHGLILA